MADRTAVESLTAREARLRRRLVTPEGLDLGVVLADAGQRVSAFFLDVLVIFILLIVLTLFVIFGIFGVGALGDPGREAMVVIWMFGRFILLNGYFIGFELRGRAATPGKRATGIRVIARDGGRLTADAVIARNLMREIEVFLPLSFLGAQAAEGMADRWLNLLGFGGIFLLFPFFNKDRLRVGDLLAGTWVIRARPQKLAIDLGAATEQIAWGYKFTEAQLDVYGEYELQTLESVLRQNNREALEPFTAAIAARIGWEDYIRDPQVFLTEFYGALRPRLERRMLFGKRKADKTVR